VNIAHILSSFAIGGQERVALDLARAQLKLGHRVVAFSIAPPPDGPLAEEFRAAGVATETVPKGPWTDPTLPFRLALRLRHHSVAVVHTHNPFAMIYGAPAGKLARAKVVHTKHGRNAGSWRRLALRRLIARLADAYVAVSRITADQARRARDIDERKLHVIPNGIDLSRFGPDARARSAVRRELGIPDDAWVVGTVGRLMDYKNQALLVGALRSELGADSRLVIVGDGPERGNLARSASDGGVAAWVHLTGARSDVPRLLTAFDVFALPSRLEGLPLVLPEAMATSLPVVATAVGGVPTVVVEGVTGYLVPSEDQAALRARLLALAADRQEARALGARGRALAFERFSLERMSADYMALYERLVGSTTV